MVRLALVVLWPSFLVALVAEGFFFSWFDPHDLSIGANHPDLSPIALYTVGFFFFWAICSLASMLTSYLTVSGPQRPPPKPGE